MTKRLTREIGISVREAEWQLDADAYLEEQWCWTPGGLHHEYLYQQMFSHAATTGQSVYDHAIHWGEREPLPKQDLGVEPTAMELICPDSIQEEIGDLYWDVYQLQRLPRRGWWEEATKEWLHQNILDSLKECLWLKWLSAQPEEWCRQMPANVPWPDAQSEFVAANCHTYEGFMALKEDSCEGMLAIARDAYCWVLAAEAMLEDKIEWLSNSISCHCSGSHQHSGSLWCRWSRSAGHHGDPQVTSHHGESEDRAGGPRWLPTRGYHPIMDPVPKPNPTEVPGNICRGEGTCVWQGEPRKRCQGGWSPPDVPANLVNWRCDAQWFWLVEGRGRKRGIRLSPTTGAPPPGALEWGGDVSSQYRSGGWLPTNFQCLMIPNLVQCKMWNGCGGVLNR